MVITAALLGLIAILIIELFPLIREVVTNTGDESKMVNYINSYGIKGIPILMGLQILQIITAVIPAAAIQLLTGLCYGVWWGTLINLSGSILGNILVISAMRQLKSLFAPFLKKEKSRKGFLSADMLSRVKRPELIAFFFFLIPVFPNGIVPYVFSETKVPLTRYVIVVAAGSLPAMLICTFLGDRLSNGSYTTALIIAIVVVLIVAVALLFRKKIMARFTREKDD